MIPVVVHVVHRNDEQNVSDAVIRNQIEILNNDFRLRNVDRLNTPSLFTPLAADTRIQFYLACRDPQGNPHSGIIRKRTTHTNTVSGSVNRFVVEDNTVAFDSESGSNSWDNTKYLNIYVADFYSKNFGDEILGVGHFPHQTYTLYNQSPNSTRSNVVSILQVDYKAFGSGQSYLTSGANFGRTATHEIGHWLELRHIWGDENGCSGSDLVDDTPNQAGSSPFNPNACLNHPKDDGCSTAIMFMNYMDYSADNCMNIFTNGQRNRMRNCLDPNASADVRRTLTYDKVYIESSSTVEFLSANEERTFTLMGAGSSGTVNWSVSPSLVIMSQTGTTLRVKAKDGFGSGWVQASVNNFGICSNISIPDFRFDFSIRPTIILGVCTSNQDFRGVKDKITCDEISGWALNVSNFNENVGVKISVDWGSQVTAATNLQRTYPGASSTAPLSVHGFAYLPSANASWKDGTNHTIRLTDICENIVFATQILNCPFPSITTNIASWSPSANAEIQSVTVSANGSWTASSDATNWLTITNVTGQGFTMNATLNSGGQRLGVVTITSGSSIKRINVIQLGSSGSCTYTEGQFLFNWYGENVYAHLCGTKKYVTTSAGSGGTYKPRHWLEATNYAQANCFEQDDPRPAGCGGGGCSSPTPSLSASSPNVPSTLSASGCSGMVNWSNGSSGGSINVTVAGTYTATCTNSGCSTSGNGSVTVGSGGGGGTCTYTEGQYLFNWYGENVYAHLCGTKKYVTTNTGSGGTYKPRHWLVATNYAQANCFEENDPRPAGCSGGGCSSPAPSLSASSPNVPSTLTANGCGGTVNWSNGSTGSSINVTVAGTYTATCTNSGCSTSGNGSVSVGSGGGGGCTFTDGQFLLTYNGETIQAKFCNGILYARATWGAWKHPNWLMGAGMNPTTASCFATSNPGCGALGRMSAVSMDEPVGEINLYPNPTTGKVKIVFSLSKDENVWFNLYDIQGKSLDLKDYEGKAGRNMMEYDLQNFPSGAYFINLQSSEKREILKVVKID